jgi:hypothetical protein
VNTYRARFLALLLLDVVSRHANAWITGDEMTCPAVASYKNDEYAFQLKIPGQLRGCPDSPVGISDHGVLIRLSSKSSVDAFASYNVLTFQTVEEAVDWEIDNLTKASASDSFVLQSRTSATLGSLKAERIVADFRDPSTGVAKRADVTVALRSAKDKSGLGLYWLSYMVSMVAPAQEYPSRRQVLDAILGSWETLPIEQPNSH